MLCIIISFEMWLHLHMIQPTIQWRQYRIFKVLRVCLLMLVSLTSFQRCHDFDLLCNEIDTLLKSESFYNNITATKLFGFVIVFVTSSSNNIVHPLYIVFNEIDPHINIVMIRKNTKRQK